LCYPIYNLIIELIYDLENIILDIWGNSDMLSVGKKDCSGSRTKKDKIRFAHVKTNKTLSEKDSKKENTRMNFGE
jgi:hypothetical protein